MLMCGEFMELICEFTAIFEPELQAYVGFEKHFNARRALFNKSPQDV